MNGRLYEGSGFIIFLILGIAVLVVLYFFTSIFWPFIVPMIFIFKPLKNMLILHFGKWETKLHAICS